VLLIYFPAVIFPMTLMVEDFVGNTSLMLKNIQFKKIFRRF